MDTPHNPHDPTLPEFSRLATPEERAENEKSLNNILLLFPMLPREKIGHLLMEATAFPFCDLQHAEGQLRDAAKRSGGDWEKAIELAYGEIDESMRNEPPATE